MHDLPTAARNGWILCRDLRLSRLLETELAYLGVSSVTYPTLPPPGETACLILADGDEFGAESCLTLAGTCGCPLLIFGRTPAEVPAEISPGGGRAVFLRRPFALTELECIIKLLLGHTVFGSLTGAVATSHSVPQQTDSAITVRDGTVTVGGRAVTLTPAERSMFDCLYARRGEAVPREELSALLEGGGNIVDVYVCRLRAKIEEPLGRRVIRTVRGVGYRMEEI